MSMTLSELKTNLESVQDQVRTYGKDALLGAFRDFFEKNPDIAALKWSQYTPYFNDGDSCIFSVHDFSFRMKGNTDDYGDDEFHSTWSPNPVIKAIGNRVKEFRKSVVCSEIFEVAFGDHVECVATVEGIEVSEYNHD
jgi:hypothetical protein